MGFLDKVKETVSEGLEKGQDIAKTQQLKLELRKLEGALDDAYAAYGRTAYAAAGDGASGTESQAIRDAAAAVEAKRAEIVAVGDDPT